MRTPRLPLAIPFIVLLSACGGPAPEPGTASDPRAPAPLGGASDGPVFLSSEAHSATPAVDPPPRPQRPESTSPPESKTPPESQSQPRMREFVIAAGTMLKVRLAHALASDSSRIEDPVTATMTAPVLVRGDAVVPRGAQLRGRVLAVERSGKVKGRARLVFRFDTLTVNGEDYDARTERVSRLARATKAKDAQKIGIGAGAGALIGAIAGGGKGAAIGSAVGAGAGGGVVAATRGEEVRLPAGTVITTRLAEAVSLRVPAR